MMEITYKLKSGYQIQDVANEKVLMVGMGNHINLSKMIILNETATVLIDLLSQKAVTLNQLIECLTSQYNVTRTQAQADVEQLLNQLDELRVLQD